MEEPTRKTLAMLFRISHEDGTARYPKKAGRKTARHRTKQKKPLLTVFIDNEETGGVRGVPKSADLEKNVSTTQDQLLIEVSQASEHTTKVHLGVSHPQTAPTIGDPRAMTAKTTALAASETSGFAPPPAPIPLRAPKIPGHVKAVMATIKAEKMEDRYQVTGARPSSVVKPMATKLAGNNDSKGISCGSIESGHLTTARSYLSRNHFGKDI
jgi:hypothetical protein